MLKTTTQVLEGKTILIIDDEQLMCKLIESIFTAEGSKVEAALSGEEGMRIFSNGQFDLVLLDIMLPGEDGLLVCRKFRESSIVPIILLTALRSDQHIVEGLDAGADDYVVKPFDREVLLARSRAVLRRPFPIIEDSLPFIYDDGFLQIDLPARRVAVRGKPIKLSTTEFRLLAFLIRHADHTCNFEEILENVWGESYRFSAEYVHVYIWHLRRKIEPDPKEPHYLLSEHGAGYRFNLEEPTETKDTKNRKANGF